MHMHNVTLAVHILLLTTMLNMDVLAAARYSRVHICRMEHAHTCKYIPLSHNKQAEVRNASYAYA